MVVLEHLVEHLLVTSVAPVALHLDHGSVTPMTRIIVLGLGAVFVHAKDGVGHCLVASSVLSRSVCRAVLD